MQLVSHRKMLWQTATTGATDRGDGTPTGTLHVYAKQRNTMLHPAGGGAYPVKYWMPYNGAYGMHDASWQKSSYGSGKYRTQGASQLHTLPGCSHGAAVRVVADRHHHHRPALTDKPGALKVAGVTVRVTA